MKNVTFSHIIEEKLQKVKKKIENLFDWVLIFFYKLGKISIG